MNTPFSATSTGVLLATLSAMALPRAAESAEQTVPTAPKGTRVALATSHGFDDRSHLTSRVTTGDIDLDLPPFFHARLVAKLDAVARHIAIREDGIIYVRLLKPGSVPTGRTKSDGTPIVRTVPGTIVALRDTDGDGIADEEKRFGGNEGGTGIHLHRGYLYYTTITGVFRRKINGTEWIPSGREESVVRGLPEQPGHQAKPLAFDNQGHLYVTIGAPSNACMKESRTRGSPGQRPCPELEVQGAIWQFRTEPGQTLKDGRKYASGLRQVVALEWGQGGLHAIQHGRDQLHNLFPEHFSQIDSAELPAEEFLALHEGFVGGWPYTYFDWRRGVRMVGPEYGGDGFKTTEEYPDPILAFPGHYAPNDLIFYEADQFPEAYRGAALVAFHGSWNRNQQGQRGYHVAAVPFVNGKPGKPHVFVDGFAGQKFLATSLDATHRPMGLAVGPDGELYVTDSRQGYVWRVDYFGE